MGILDRTIVPECVLLDITVSAKADLLRQMIESLHASGFLSDGELLFRDVMAREAEASTCLGYGCAVPHAHSAALDKTLLAIARLKPPLAMETPDGKPVSLVFLMAGPKDSAGLHLKLLSKLARLLHDVALRDALETAATPAAFCRLLLERDS
jgi:mannitol/fructose-specific phosphotransferase system IIA component (Ntr-type)